MMGALPRRGADGKGKHGRETPSGSVWNFVELALKACRTYGL